MKKFIHTKWFTYGTYILLVLATTLIGLVIMQNNATLNKIITSFFEVAENRTFDYRQSLRVSHKSPAPNKDIVILAIDDSSLELLWDKYGEWPIPRKVYADVINYLEKYDPKAIIFDLLFIKSIRSDIASDNALIEAMNKYDNIYTAMNFDNQPFDLRQPIDLPKRMIMHVGGSDSDIDIESKYTFTNCRPILQKLIEGNVKIGISNVIRNNDGIIRKVAPLMAYKGNYYPYLAFKVGCNSAYKRNMKAVFIDKYRRMMVGSSTVPLTKDGEAILNWYGPS